MKRDVAIIGGGPAAIYAAYEFALKYPDIKVVILEEGHAIDFRNCPIIAGKTEQCVRCTPCSIMRGFGGAGAFSDGKYNFTTEFGGWLTDYMDHNEVMELIHYVDDVNVAHGATTNYFSTTTPEAQALAKKALEFDLHLLQAQCKHLGTEKNLMILTNIYEDLKDKMDFHFNTAISEIKTCSEGYELVTEKGDTYYAKEIISAVGREGADWFSHICKEKEIETKVGTVDIGVRVEVRDEVMDFLNTNLYEAKLVYHTPTFDDKVRTFCTNPSGEVATEYYDDGLAVVNGHAYKSKDMKTNNTNFALLVSKNFTKPFKTPIEYGKQIAQLSNMLCDGKILVQTFGDFKRGRRTTEERLARNNLIPTLKDAVPGDLSLVFPHRIMVDIEEMLEALDKVTPGIASDETLLYGVEVKFYSNKVVVSKDFETSIKGLRAIGDGASVTRGLQQASANGISVARSILKSLEA